MVVSADQAAAALGGNVVRRDLGDELMRAIARDLKASIEYGLAHRAEALRHAQGFSRGLDADRTDRFVGMYVNAYTVDYGSLGRRAVAELLARAHAAGLIPAPVDLAFVAAIPVWPWRHKEHRVDRSSGNRHRLGGR